ncbi:MAG: hypothetical protein R3C60_15390 [Parvularculaceae bacterium]
MTTADALAAILERWPEGTVEGRFNGGKWRASLTRETSAQKLTLFARTAAGGDFVSANFYRLQSGWAARPCEMPLSKVAAFIEGFRPEAAE